MRNEFSQSETGREVVWQRDIDVEGRYIGRVKQEIHLLAGAPWVPSNIERSPNGRWEEILQCKMNSSY